MKIIKQSANPTFHQMDSLCTISAIERTLQHWQNKSLTNCPYGFFSTVWSNSTVNYPQFYASVYNVFKNCT